MCVCAPHLSRNPHLASPAAASSAHDDVYDGDKYNVAALQARAT
jgi:hypothetical protein